jgi:nucleoside 2-deoxyribosyltransferase
MAVVSYPQYYNFSCYMPPLSTAINYDVIGGVKIDMQTSPKQESKLLIYLAGPYRSKDGFAGVERNIHKAKQAAQEFWKHGFAVICPHANTAFMDGTVSADEFIAGDLEMVSRCDAVIMLKGWVDSEGAKQEFDFANKNGIYVWDHYAITSTWKKHDFDLLKGYIKSHLAAKPAAKDPYKEKYEMEVKQSKEWQKMWDSEFQKHTKTLSELGTLKSKLKDLTK